MDIPITYGGLSRRNSNSSAATFDLVSGNRSPLPEAESCVPISADEELINLRADKERLTTIIADMQYALKFLPLITFSNCLLVAFLTLVPLRLFSLRF